MATCRGVDVSEHQSPQDWAAHKRAGVVFAWAKASEGQHSRDSSLDAHIGGIIKAGLVPGGYHFGWPNQDPVVEANNYIGAVRPYAAASPFVHWLDLERYPDGRNYAGRTDTQILAYARTWMARVQAAFPRQRVGVYTSADDIAKGHLPPGVPLWYPAYPGTSVDNYAEAEARLRPSPSGRQPLIWQFTSDPEGSGPRIDLNICYLSADGLRAWAAGEEDDMALTDADVKKVADAVYAKIMGTEDLKVPIDLDKDGTWTLRTLLVFLLAQTRATGGQVSVANSKLAMLDSQLAQLDPVALQAALVARLAGLKVDITVTKPEG